MQRKNSFLIFFFLVVSFLYSFIQRNQRIVTTNVINQKKSCSASQSFQASTSSQFIVDNQPQCQRNIAFRWQRCVHFCSRPGWTQDTGEYFVHCKLDSDLFVHPTSTFVVLDFCSPHSKISFSIGKKKKKNVIYYVNNMLCTLFVLIRINII